MQILSLLFLLYTLTLGGAINQVCGIPTHLFDEMVVQTTEGQAYFPTDELYELRTNSFNGDTADYALVAAGGLINEELPSYLMPTFIIYADSDRNYLIEVYPVNVWDFPDTEACYFGRLYL